VKSRPPTFTKTVKRYALVFDVVCGAALAIVAMKLAGGIGVVGFGTLVVLLVGLAWMGLEGALRHLRRQASTRR
jgi:hypothetical protein